jgi:ubiquinone/menaquinone biosynthesis C-methylase UbiE
MPRRPTRRLSDGQGGTVENLLDSEANIKIRFADNLSTTSRVSWFGLEDGGLMALTDKYEVERSKWDALAPEDIQGSSLMLRHPSFDSYARTTDKLLLVTEFLGDLSGKRVLELGCGLGELSILLARSGAEVTTFDLSEKRVDMTRSLADQEGVQDKIDLAVAAGEYLPYRDESFDVVIGKAILHHLVVKLGAPEIHRVLKNSGKAAFVEPMGMNPALAFARARVPYPNKNPRGADIPLHYEEIEAWGEPYRRFRYQEVQLLSMLERAFGFGRHFHTLRRIDRYLLKHVSVVRRYARHVVLMMEK